MKNNINYLSRPYTGCFSLLKRWGEISPEGSVSILLSIALSAAEKQYMIDWGNFGETWDPFHMAKKSSLIILRIIIHVPHVVHISLFKSPYVLVRHLK